MSEYHVPVLYEASLDGLNIASDGGVYVDVTFGGGGHSRGILERMKTGTLYGFDQDLDAMANAPDDPRFVFVRSNFRYLKNFMKYHRVEQVDGILADLGVSSHHFDAAERGFSFRYEDVSLDMRMNRASERTAGWVLNTYTESALADVLFQYGELRQARRMAQAIVKARETQPLEHISTLLEVLRPHVPKAREKKEMAKVFQAIRMEVNQEIQVLEELLQQSLGLLKPSGRLVVLTYHSLEDRLVKNFMRSGRIDGVVEQDFYGNFLTPFKLINTKVMVASAEEQAENPRSRSAKLRIAEKK